jgi:hypothetical protein
MQKVIENIAVLKRCTAVRDQTPDYAPNQRQHNNDFNRER